MHTTQALERVVDLTDPRKNVLFSHTVDEARSLVGSGDAEGVRRIDGHFALVATSGQSVRMARSIGRPLRYFIAKRAAGPALVAADRIDTIRNYLAAEGLADQFHPTYTRMVPAHHIIDVALVGCPDPNPTYCRFFTPQRNVLPADVDIIGRTYIAEVYAAVCRWLRTRATAGPVGVLFSGGIDSGSIFLVTYHAMLTLGMNPARLKAFTLSVDGGGDDLGRAQRFLESLDLGLFLEPIEVPAEAVDWREAVRVVEDYKPLDIQSAAMGLALCRAIRARYPDWRYLIDGDGGDENLKDYPIEENSELTIRSVLNNRLLYQEGWGIDSIKHSLTYSGGLSRAYSRTYAPADVCGFEGFSPYTLPDVTQVAEGIPFIALTDWSHERLYQLKGEVVSRGVRALTGFDMPVYEKCRFQHGAPRKSSLPELFPRYEAAYRRAFYALYES